jgi:hypothetical protein
MDAQASWGGNNSSWMLNQATANMAGNKILERSWSLNSLTLALQIPDGQFFTINTSRMRLPEEYKTDKDLPLPSIQMHT